MFWFFPVYCAFSSARRCFFILFNMKFFGASSGDFLRLFGDLPRRTELIRNHLYGKVRWPGFRTLFLHPVGLPVPRRLQALSPIRAGRPSNVTAKGMSNTRRSACRNCPCLISLIYAYSASRCSWPPIANSHRPEISGQLLIRRGLELSEPDHCRRQHSAWSPNGANDVAGIQLASSASVSELSATRCHRHGSSSFVAGCQDGTCPQSGIRPCPRATTAACR